MPGHARYGSLVSPQQPDSQPNPDRLERDHLAERIQPPGAARAARRPSLVRRLSPWLLLVVAVGAFAAGLAVALSGSSDETATAPSPTTAPPAGGDTTDPTAPAGSGADATGDDGGAAVASTATAPPLTDTTVDPDLPHLQARLDLAADPADGVFSVVGRLPEGPPNDGVASAVALAYTPVAVSDIVVDPEAPTEPWMAAAPRILPLLGLTSGGTVTLSAHGLRLEGTVGQEATATVLIDTIQQLWDGAGAEGPVDVDGLEVTGLAHPSARIEVDGGRVTLEGALPEQRLADQLESAARQLYGDEAVEADLEVDDGTYEALWMYTLPAFLPRFEPFPTYEIRLEDGTITGRIDSDGLYDVDAVELREEAGPVLLVAASVLTRDPRLVMTIVGHTDATGPDDYNLELSQRRADGAKATLVSLGIEADRLTAEGRGEEEPIADNDTSAGRAANRRAEFSFGLDDS